MNITLHKYKHHRLAKQAIAQTFSFVHKQPVFVHFVWSKSKMLVNLPVIW